MMDTSIFQNLIKERCGLVFEESIKARLESGIRARMSKKGTASLTEYFNCILRDQNEFNDLVDLLTVNETYFMREPFHLELLVKRLIPELLACKNPGERIKIISAGCSTGEEPYSVIMTLMENFGTEIRNLFSVIGVDIDSKALRSAAEGKYNPHSFRALDKEMKKKYFVASGDSCYVLKDVVKDKAEFHRLNFLDKQYPEVLKGADVIFYRNVSIYFKPETQDKIFRKLAELLNDEGCLIVSSTETLAHDTGVLSLMECDGIYLFRKNGRRAAVGQCPPAGPKDLYMTLSAPEPDKPKFKNVPSGGKREYELRRHAHGSNGLSDKTFKLSKRVEESEALFNEALSCAADKEYAEVLKKIDKLLAVNPAFVKALTLKASVLINLKRFEEADGLCLKCVALDQWCLEGYLLMGLSAYFRSDAEAALKRFREALYVNTSCWLAHFYLAEIYRSWGDAETACREYGIVVKLLKEGDFPEHGLTYFPLSFAKEHIQHMCSHNLSRLKAQMKAVRRRTDGD